MKPFEYVKEEAVRFFFKYNSALYMDRWLQDKREKEKNGFFIHQILEKLQCESEF